ncbi:MAG: MFS transporter [Thermomicrobiales bacterium]
MSDTNSAPIKSDPWEAVRVPDFRLLLTGEFLRGFAHAMLSVLIGWELFQRTGSAVALGLVGLVQIVPNVLLALPIGHFADQHNPQRIAVTATAVDALAALALAGLAATHGPIPLFYVCLFMIGLCRTFISATETALLASVAPASLFSNAAAWGTSSWQTAAVLGPALGGLAIAAWNNTAIVFGIAAAMIAGGALLLGMMHPRKLEQHHEPLSREALFAGVHFLRKTPILLAAITLDMVAVLLGGATALLPIFAEEVLHVGASGLGLLRAAPAVGAVVMSVLLVRKGPFHRAGVTLLLAVAGFGVAMVLFGASRTLGLSMAALGMAGACDVISMVIRHTMQLTYTPDFMRGRVSAVHHLFIGMSNEFGEFESGIMAAIFGATTAVVIGGIGTLATVAIIAVVWPQVRNLQQIRLPGESEAEVLAGATQAAETPAI